MKLAWAQFMRTLIACAPTEATQWRPPQNRRPQNRLIITTWPTRAGARVPETKVPTVKWASRAAPRGWGPCPRRPRIEVRSRCTRRGWPTGRTWATLCTTTVIRSRKAGSDRIRVLVWPILPRHKKLFFEAGLQIKAITNHLLCRRKLSSMPQKEKRPLPKCEEDSAFPPCLLFIISTSPLHLEDAKKNCDQRHLAVALAFLAAVSL